jgi:choline dehydrogenase-like flavoprotein
MNMNDLDELERMIDAEGLRTVLQGLSCVATMKGDYCAAVIRDERLTNAWRAIARNIALHTNLTSVEEVSRTMVIRKPARGTGRPSVILTKKAV